MVQERGGSKKQLIQNSLCNFVPDPIMHSNDTQHVDDTPIRTSNFIRSCKRTLVLVGVVVGENGGEGEKKGVNGVSPLAGYV